VSGGIAQLFLNLGTRRGVWSASRPGRFYPGERPGTHCTGGWVGPGAGLDRCGKSRPTGIPSPDLPAMSTSTLPIINITDIREETGAQNIVEEIKQYQKKSLQHVQRMDTNRISKQALLYRPKGRRNIGRPKKRWRDQIHFEDQGTRKTPNPSGT